MREKNWIIIIFIKKKKNQVSIKLQDSWQIH